MDKLHYSLFLLSFLAIFLGAFALATVQTTFDKDPQVQANKDNISFLLEQSSRVTDRHDTIVNEIINQTRDVLELQDTLALYKGEIVKNKQKINLNHPVAGNIPDDPQGTGTAETPLFSVETDRESLTRGESITFSGQANPDSLVSLFASSPSLTQTLQEATVTDELGKYVIDVETEFDSELGTWKARITHLDSILFLEFEITE